MTSISVIVPVYNALARLPRCVQSVLGQTLPDFELILVDDGSPDASGKLCDAFALVDGRIHVIHQFNQGVSAARNAGLAAASGRWVVFLDADDALAPCALQTALAAQTQNPNHLVLWPFAASEQQLPAQAAPLGEPFCAQHTSALYLNCRFSMPWNKLLCRQLLCDAALGFDPAYSLGEDLLFCLAYAQAFFAAGGAGYYLLKAPLTFYDLSDNPASLSQKYRPDAAALWLGLTGQVLAACAQLDCPPTQLDEIALGGLHQLVAGLSQLMAQRALPFRHRLGQAKALLAGPRARALVDQLQKSNRSSPYLSLAKQGAVLPLVWRYRRVQHQIQKKETRL